MIPNADFRSLVSETVSMFRDAHTWISTKANGKLSLNIGLAYGEAEKQYPMYKANPEIYIELGLGSLEEFLDGRFVVTALNNVPMPKVEQMLSRCWLIRIRSHNAVMPEFHFRRRKDSSSCLR